MRNFRVSGTAMAVLADEVTPQVAASLTAAGAVRRGRGVSYEVSLPAVQADELRVLCLLRGRELLAVEVDEPLRAAGKALLVVAESIEHAPDVEHLCPCGAVVRVEGAYCDECEAAV